MLSLWFNLALLSSVHAFSGNRIVNGTDAAPGEIPYIVSLKFGIGHYVRIHICGGSIVSEYWILTAAHCAYYWKPTALSVQYGIAQISNDGLNTIPVEKAIYHPNYVPGNGYVNDVALLKLEQSLQFSDFAQPVTLPPAFNATPSGAEAVLAGWGLLKSEGLSFTKLLQRVDLNVYTDEKCECLHALTGPTDRRYHVCAGVVGGGKGQCTGDSGGPLVVNGTQVGIVSWSVKPCTIAPYPGVFTKVSNYVEWIYEVIAEDEEYKLNAAV